MVDQSYFHTEYIDRANNARYGVGFWAEDIYEAEHLIRLRGLGEKIWGESDGQHKGEWRHISTWAYKRESKFQDQLPMILHHLMLMCLVGLQSGRLQAWECFGDGSAVHEIVHRLNFGVDKTECRTRDGIVALVENIERRVPEFFKDERQ